MKNFPLGASLVVGLAAITAVAALAAAADAAHRDAIVWRLDRLHPAGAGTPVVLGAPREVTEEGRKALRFDGAADGLVFPRHPLAGAPAFTIEVLFKPDADGPLAQRFVHVEDTAENRALIETRVTPDGRWYLDTFLFSKPRENGVTLVDKSKLHPCGRWYWAALVYDGKVMSHFLDAKKELEGTIAYGPMTEGRTSVGVRLNQVYWFKGAIAEVRFHRRALPAVELQHSN